MTALSIAARRYAEFGWHVFPLRPHTKKPLTTHGFHDATSDVAKVTAWWEATPDANIGLLPGPSGLVVVDVDGPDGETAARSLGLVAEPTLTVTTGRPNGGRHLYFQRPDFRVGNRSLSAHLDVRGDDGYVVVPPSVHPSGAAYAWAGKLEDLKPLPPDVVAALRRRNGAKVAPQLPERIPEGQRNATLTSLAGSMRRRGASGQDILTALCEENALRCDPPLADSELECIAHSIARYEPAEGTQALFLTPGSEDGNPETASAPAQLKSQSPSSDHTKTDLAQSSVTHRKQTHAQLLISIAETADLFHTPAGDAYSTMPVDGHEETWPLRSRGFTGWLRRAFYNDQERPPNAQAMADALAILEARAQFDSDQHSVFLRVGEYDGRVYVDLVNERWEAVEVSSEGWRVVAEPPVRFRRARGMLPMPYPEEGGSLADLRRFINVDADDWPLILAWLVGAFRPRGPYPVLVLQGEQGSAKSSAARLLRALVDPSAAPGRTTPRSEQDLMIALNNGWVISFDNLSRLPDWLSDGLCRVATGAGFSARQLYTDSDEVIFNGQRPVILNGITEIATRDDLRDRALLVTCPTISEAARLEESVMEEAFAAVHPRLLGAHFDAVSAALMNFPTTALTVKPRMADFARWVAAAEPEFGWPSGTFLSTYAGNRQMAVEQGLEFDPIGQALRQLAEERAWDGTVGELLEPLGGFVASHVREGREWPQNARALSDRLRRVTPSLRHVGILVEFGTRTKKGRAVTIRKDPQATVTSVTTNTPALKPGGSGDGCSDGGCHTELFVNPTVTPIKLSRLDNDGDDDGERTKRTHSGPGRDQGDGFERHQGHGEHPLAILADVFNAVPMDAQSAHVLDAAREASGPEGSPPDPEAA